jgi:hypothetical protein
MKGKTYNRHVKIPGAENNVSSDIALEQMVSNKSVNIYI